jgi:hypothetical protein
MSTRQTRLTTALILTATIALVAALAAGCSASVGSSSGSTDLVTYDNAEYGFSLQHQERFSETGDTSYGTTGGSGAAFNIGFVDPEGATTEGGTTGIDGILVSVYQMKQSIEPEQVPLLRDSLESVVAGLKKNQPDALFQPLEETTVNGTPGFKMAYTMPSGGEQLVAETYFLIKGDKEYQLTIQSAEENWEANKPALQQSVDSFTVK